MMSFAAGSRHHYVVLANPSPKSFCHAVAHAYVDEVRRGGQTADILDLYGIALNPALKNEEAFTHGDRHHPWIEAELERVRASGALVLVYPIWFGGPLNRAGFVGGPNS
jgi:NAD(P)H dehydrogenase (quinone)